MKMIKGSMLLYGGGFNLPFLERQHGLHWKMEIYKGTVRNAEEVESVYWRAKRYALKLNNPLWMSGSLMVNNQICILKI